MRLIPLTDTERLREIGWPFSRSYSFKLRCMNKYPRLILKIGHRLLVDAEEFERMVEEDVAKREKMKKGFNAKPTHPQKERTQRSGGRAGFHKITGDILSIDMSRL